ncbi:energy-coupling factor transporter transmembrane component T [Agromyces cerinus]|uniref:Energy-coupling factor transport system permease protein n=1 Tax=Agromyces cerinus subsp. cerinus TaxID=232089 RepID=A0A1N6EYW6_9MICO|nr:energy-coupling factor transporter transmembrane component T [Agromyces cerinus]SIN88167.1 energy-coupling factor transport system permease protein [Agromyces cerinus subsp. cerinus]
MSAAGEGGAVTPEVSATPADGSGAHAASAALDPFAEHRTQRPSRFLYALNPLAKLAAPVPVMVIVMFSRGIALPLAFIVFAAAVLLIGARLSGRAIAALLLGIPIAALVLGVTFGVWIDPSSVAGHPAASVTLISIGDWDFTLAAYLVGFATGLRILAILLLSLIAGVTSTGTEFVRSMVQNLRVPYRLGYTALAALRFVPRFGHELEIIRAAHRVRGTDVGRGPVAAVRRAVGYIVPLLASAIRHAERVALAMDARAFGAHRTRTERHFSPWRVRDTVFVACFLAVSIVIAVLTWGR